MYWSVPSFPAKRVFQSGTSVWVAVWVRGCIDRGRVLCDGVRAARVTWAPAISVRLVTRPARCKRSSLRELWSGKFYLTLLSEAKTQYEMWLSFGSIITWCTRLTVSVILTRCKMFKPLCVVNVLKWNRSFNNNKLASPSKCMIKCCTLQI